MSKRFLVAALLVGTGICLFCLSLITGPSRSEAQEPPRLTQTLKIEAEGLSFTVRYPNGWSAAQEANVYTLLNVPAEQRNTLNAAALDKVAQIVIFTERRRDHAEAMRRLKEIEAAANSPSTFLTIGGWPALQRRHFAPKPQPGQGPSLGEPSEMELEITTAVAAENLLVRLEGRLRPDAPPKAADQIEAIGRSLVFPTSGDPDQVEKEIRDLRMNPRLGSSLFTPVPETLGSSEVSSEASAGTPLRVTRTGGTSSELEVAVSPDGQNIVIGSNANTSISSLPSNYFSTDGGQIFNQSSGVVGKDPSLAFGPFVSSSVPNGTFYSANISGNATGLSVSTDNGQTFTFRSNAYTCGQGNDPPCGQGFPDQEHIAADRFNTAPGGDQVYSVWRHLTVAGWGIVCSTDRGNTWSTNGFFTPGDFPRITVGQDGFVYVVYRDGFNIMLRRFNSCQTNQNPMVVAAPVAVAENITVVACPVPGLDRCNDGNFLSSHTVAVDDTNANHIYAAYAVNTSPGGGGFPSCMNQNTCNENVLIRDSTDGGITWPAARAVTVNSGVTARRFMPWLCAVGGVAKVSWYDRRAINAANASSNDLTDYFRGSAFLDDQGNLVSGMEFQVNAPGTADPQCAIGWPGGVRSPNDSDSCSAQPQKAGFCSVSGSRCDFNDPRFGCPTGETCNTSDGQPKYGDYNGNACAAGRLYMAWASATPLALGGIDIFFAVERPFSSDVSITKTASPDPVTTGNDLTYTVTVTNNGPDIANTVTVTDNLPAETTFVSCFSTGGGDCGGSANNQMVTFASLASGESETITFVTTVKCSVADGTVISNTATVRSVTPDPNPSNNSATVATTASNPPPTISGASANPSVLWPPNHKLVNVTVNYDVTDNCPLPPNSCTLSVTSDEPINGTGDGNTSPDWIILDAHHVQLRAERAGNGNGRIYTIGITCVDSGRSSSHKPVDVTVPHDRGRH